MLLAYAVSLCKNKQIQCCICIVFFKYTSDITFSIVLISSVVYYIYWSVIHYMWYNSELSLDEIIHSFTSPGCGHLRGVLSTWTFHGCLDEWNYRRSSSSIKALNTGPFQSGLCHLRHLSSTVSSSNIIVGFT